MRCLTAPSLIPRSFAASGTLTLSTTLRHPHPLFTHLLCHSHSSRPENRLLMRPFFDIFPMLKRASKEALAYSPIPRSLRSLRFFFPLRCNDFCKEYDRQVLDG